MYYLNPHKLISCKTIFFSITIFATSMLFPKFNYTSQIGQDRILNEQFFNNKRNGIFIDIGAHDGVSHSNTYFFEKELGWSGICFEPLPIIFKQLAHNRTCICINACVSKTEGFLKFFAVEGYSEMLSGLVNTYDPRHLERLQKEIAIYGGKYSIIEVPSVQLNKILEKNKINRIDLLSIDTEGSEFEILQSIDFNSLSIWAITVENNYENPEIRNLLTSKGFTFITYIGKQDEIYINENYNN